MSTAANKPRYPNPSRLMRQSHSIRMYPCGIHSMFDDTEGPGLLFFADSVTVQARLNLR